MRFNDLVLEGAALDLSCRFERAGTEAFVPDC